MTEQQYEYIIDGISKQTGYSKKTIGMILDFFIQYNQYDAKQKEEINKEIITAFKSGPLYNMSLRPSEDF